MTTPAVPVAPNPFHESGEWLKCALHTHSTVSDGTLSPQHLAASYEDAGFDVLAITDHWRLTAVEPTDRLLTVPAAELGWDIAHPRYPRQSAEFLVYGIDHVPDDPGGNRDNWMFNAEENWEARTFPDLTAGVRWADAQGAVVYVAHPYWNHLDPEDIATQEGFVGLEVFNGSAHLEDGRGDSSVWWDTLLGRGRQVFGIGTDDQHYPLFELGTAWTMVKAAERTQHAVLDALRNGQSYFSHGPSIHDVSVDGSAVEVSCSPARSVRLQMEEEHGVSVTVGRGGRRQGQILQTDGSGLITRARLETARDNPRYRRVTVVDAAGNQAWSNPV
ncbi:MAG: CehA/McbA family metallohydrolase [Actinomycetes bacterium]